MQLFSKVSFLLSFAGLWATHAQVTFSSRTAQLGGNATYFVPGTPVASFSFGRNTHAMGQLQALGQKTPLIPFSFITTSVSKFSASHLDDVTTMWSGLDDVWSPLFLQGEQKFSSVVLEVYTHNFTRNISGI